MAEPEVCVWHDCGPPLMTLTWGKLNPSVLRASGSLCQMGVNSSASCPSSLGPMKQPLRRAEQMPGPCEDFMKNDSCHHALALEA